MWDYGITGTLGWTPDYEKVFVENFEDYQKACKDVSDAIAAINAALADGLTANLTVPNVTGVALLPLPDGAGDRGCFELFRMAEGKLEALVVEYNTAANNYNSKMDTEIPLISI